MAKYSGEKLEALGQSRENRQSGDSIGKQSWMGERKCRKSAATWVGAAVVAQGGSGAVRSSLDSQCILRVEPATSLSRDYVGCK